MRTGHGDRIHFGPKPPECVMRDEWKPLFGGPDFDELIVAAQSFVNSAGCDMTDRGDCRVCAMRDALDKLTGGDA